MGSDCIDMMRSALLQSIRVDQQIPISPNSLGNPSLPELQFEFMEELKPIEEQLNRLCSEHDELMTLLEIYEFLPNLKAWQQMHRNVAAKIAHYEQQIQELEDTQSHAKGREEAHIKTHREEVKVYIDKVEARMSAVRTAFQEQQDKLNQLEQSSEIGSKNTLSFIENIRKEARSKIDESNRAISNSVAAFKTDLEVRTLQLRNTNIDQDEELIYKCGQLCLGKQTYEYDKLQHQIELIKLQLENPQFEDFFAHTYEAIKQAIEKQRSLLSLFQTNRSSPVLSHEADIIAIFTDTYIELFYRIKGLKRHCANELLYLYSNHPNKRTVNSLQLHVNESVRELDLLLSSMKDRMSNLEELVSNR